MTRSAALLRRSFACARPISSVMDSGFITLAPAANPGGATLFPGLHAFTVIKSESCWINELKMWR